MLIKVEANSLHFTINTADITGLLSQKDDNEDAHKNYCRAIRDYRSGD